MIEGIYLMGILQGLILIGIVYYKSRFQSKESVIISLVIFISTLLVLGQFLINTQYHLRWPTLFIFITGLPLLTGPYLFFYLRSKLKMPVTTLAFAAHHGLFILYLALLVTIIEINFASDLASFIEQTTPSQDARPSQSISLIGLIKGLHLLIYTVMASLLLKKHGIGKAKGLKLILMFFIASQTMLWVLIFAKNPFVDQVFILLQVVFLYLIGYHSLLNNTSFITTRKYQSSNLSSIEAKQVFRNVEERIKNDELFVDPAFSLKKLSELTGINEHQISQSINQITGENFATFINGYRVERVKELLSDKSHSHLKILSIAFEAGFNNKNSFNEHFKRVEGITPSSYKKQLTNPGS